MKPVSILTMRDLAKREFSEERYFIEFEVKYEESK